MSVLAVVTKAEEAAPIVRWAARFARARDARLVVLHPSRGSKPGESERLSLHDPSDDHAVRNAVRVAIKETLDRLDGAQPAPAAWTGDGPSPEGEAPADVDAAAPPEAEDEAATGAGTEAKPVTEPETGPEAQAEPQTEAAPEAGKDEDVAPEFIELRRVVHIDIHDAILAERRALGSNLLVIGAHHDVKDEDAGASLSFRLLDEAICDTLLLRAGGDSGLAGERILVPVSGGPHAQVALKLGADMTERDGGRVHPLYVEPAIGDENDAENDALWVGLNEVHRLVARAGVNPDAPHVDPLVVLANRPLAGIARAAEQGWDLMLLGASDRGAVRRALFGTVPDRFLRGREAFAVGVLRRKRPITFRIWRRLREYYERRAPQLDPAARRELFQRLQRGSRFDVDFMTLIGLATAIAAFGLLLDSGAVVIGAMLVAPLMTPIIAVGLAIVQGNLPLVLEASQTIAKGFLLALAIGAGTGLVFGYVTPGSELTAQLLARGSPSELDLVVAFISGVAAGYALARPDLSSALPGVAIAAALVPPIATVGIAAAKGDWTTASGAALLFSMNVFAIILAAAFVFTLLGLRGGKARPGQVWVRRTIVALTLLLCSVATVSVVLRRLETRRGAAFPISDGLRDEIASEVRSWPGLTLLSIRSATAKEAHDIEVVVVTVGVEPPDELAERIAGLASQRYGLDEPIDVRLITIGSDAMTRATGIGDRGD